MTYLPPDHEIGRAVFWRSVRTGALIVGKYMLIGAACYVAAMIVGTFAFASLRAVFS